MDIALPYLFYVLLSVVVINCCYYLVFIRFAFLKPAYKKPEPLGKGVSLIVCAKNEAENLQKHIPLWLAQDYPELELVLIDDASSDETAAIIAAFAKKDIRINPVYVKNTEAFWGNKKYALTLGIKKATYEHLIFTDADCSPKSEHWIAEMAAQFSSGSQLILGYGGYIRIKRSLLNMLIRYETLMTALQYFSYALAGQPYMGVGRNLGYTKTLFFEQRGFIEHMQLTSGDDDLFVNKAASVANTTLSYTTSTHTLSEPERSWASWYRQKRRHITTASHYKVAHRLLLGLFYCSQFWFFPLALVLVGCLFKWPWVLGIVLLRYVIVGLALAGSTRKFEEKGLLLLFPVLELVLVCIQLAIFSANLISKPARWK